MANKRANKGFCNAAFEHLDPPTTHLFQSAAMMLLWTYEGNQHRAARPNQLRTHNKLYRPDFLPIDTFNHVSHFTIIFLSSAESTFLEEGPVRNLQRRFWVAWAFTRDLAAPESRRRRQECPSSFLLAAPTNRLRSLVFTAGGFAAMVGGCAA